MTEAEKEQALIYFEIAEAAIKMERAYVENNNAEYFKQRDFLISLNIDIQSLP